jgi:hypothetical protein
MPCRYLILLFLLAVLLMTGCCGPGRCSDEQDVLLAMESERLCKLAVNDVARLRWEVRALEARVEGRESKQGSVEMARGEVWEELFHGLHREYRVLCDRRKQLLIYLTSHPLTDKSPGDP